MIKFDKTTHLLILFTFAIIFIVLYLYSTINNVNKINLDLKKTNSDIQKINSDLQVITNSLNNLNLAINNLSIQKQSNIVETQIKQVVPSINKNTLSSPPIKTESIKSTSNTNELEEEEDDDEEVASSVDTEDLKNILNDGDKLKDDETDIDEENNSESNKSSKNDVKNVDITKFKYEELKELCKKKGISTKGTKEQLVAKLQG